MKQLVIIPGGFHPFHAGHAALYQSAQAAFPAADVYVAATNDTSTRPFPFAIKEKLAKLAGVAPGHFIQVKSPFRAEEIVHRFDPNNTQLIFVRSEKDANKPPQGGGTKKDGSPSYLQPLGDDIQPLSQHAYMAYLPTVEFGPGMTSATEIRGAWPTLNEKRKTALVMSLYPKTQTNPKLAVNVVKMLDTAMGAVDESALGNLPRPNKRNQFKSLHRLKKQRGLDEQGRTAGSLDEINRRGFLKGMGAAAAAGAAGKAGAGQFTSSDDLNKDPESIEKVWKPRVAELQARCTGILNSFKSVASSVHPEWSPIIDQVKLEVTLGDISLRFGKAKAQTGSFTLPNWSDVLKKNPNNYVLQVWSTIYPNISYRGSVGAQPAGVPGPQPTIAIQIRSDGAIVNSKLVNPSNENAWDQAVLDAINKTNILPTRTTTADEKFSNPNADAITKINIPFPINLLSITPTVTKKSTYNIFVETTVFWDAPDSTLAWVLGHEVGHLVNGIPRDVSNAQRRESELEADEVGAVLAQKIGYDRANFFQWLFNAKAEHLKNSNPNSSHPAPIDRVNNLKQKTGFELSAVKYIDSMIQQFQTGLAEASNTMQRYGQTIIKRARAARAAEQAARAAEQAARAAEPEPKKEEPPASSDYSSMSTRDYRTMMQQLKKPKNKNVAAAPDYMEENIKRQ